MALGLLLRVSWICFLLSDGGAGAPDVRGYGYPSVTDTQNMVDDGDDELAYDEELTDDQGNLEAPSYQPTGPVFIGHNKPTVARQPAWAPSQQPSAAQAERTVNGSPRDWGLENLDKPLVFPFLSSLAKPQPGPVQPPTPVSTGRPATQNAADSTYAGSTVYYAPASTSQAAKAPSFAPVDAGYGVADSSAAGANVRYLTYEEVFQYPSATERQGYGTVSNTAGGYDQANSMSKRSSTGFPTTLNYPSFPRRAGLIYPSLGRVLNFGRTANRPQNEFFLRPWKLAKKTQEVQAPKRSRGPIFPLAPPSYIMQSRNGYQRAKYHLSHSMYTPEYPQPMAVSTKGAKGQPAAPKVAKNPNRKW